MDITGQEDQLPPKPKQVTTAVLLIYASIIVGILMTILNTIITWQLQVEIYSQTNVIGYVFCNGLTYILLGWIAYKINSGRNWARIVYLILALLILLTVPNLIRSFKYYPLRDTLSAFSMVLGLIAAVLLFLSPSSAWFKTRPKRGGANH